ncbi:EcKinase 6 [Frankliniella occidentalis]|nr:EcKinase 6 [Frankliniella occidentalis]
MSAAALQEKPPCGSVLAAMATIGELDVPAVVKNALAEIAKARGFGEPRFHVESGSSAGDGYTSVMFRVNLNGTDASGKADSLSVMCKTTISDNMMMAGVFKTEDCIYKSVLPAMENIAALKEPLPWPRCYHSDVGGEKPCIVLGDLGVDNFTMADRRVPLDVKHCRLALSQLARYHGAGLALRHLKPDEFQYMADTLGASYANKEMLEAFQHFFTTIENAAGQNAGGRSVWRLLDAYGTTRLSCRRTGRTGAARLGQGVG